MAKSLIISEQKNTPRVVLDPDSCSFSIVGKSFPENAKKFYQPIYDWVDAYIPPTNSTTEFQFELYYLNSASLIAVLDLMRRLKKWRANGSVVLIKWCYDNGDDDMQKVGIDFKKALVDLPIELIENDE